MKYLVESALLTHGLRSISNQEILESWTETEAKITWVDNGQIQIGNIEEFLTFRKQAENLIRIDYLTLNQAIAKRQSGALTASGTMEVCRRYQIPMAITCGMGGIGDIKNEELCPDLPALASLPVILLSTGPKDMLDRKATYEWLRKHHVKIMGVENSVSSGYIFSGEKIELDGVIQPKVFEETPPLLIIHEISEEKRISDIDILQKAILQGKKAQEEGRYFHPAVNGAIDEMTQGYSSRIQLESLVANIKLASKFTNT